MQFLLTMLKLESCLPDSVSSPPGGSSSGSSSSSRRDNNNNRRIMEIIEKALELAGAESKGVILNYIRQKYAMTTDDAGALIKYRDEFANYLREVLGDSADIIVAKIERALKEEKEEELKKNRATGASMPVCYICNASLPPEKMRRHLATDHTKEDLAYHLAVVYVDDWREEAELQEESDSALQQLLHN